MKKIKTIRDFEGLLNWQGNLYKMADCDCLKKDVIEDIKIIEEARDLNEDLEFLHKVGGNEANAIKSYIMHKFNLEHEDLLGEEK